MRLLSHEAISHKDSLKEQKPLQTQEKELVNIA